MLLRALHNRLGSLWKFTVEALGYYLLVRGITEKEGIVWDFLLGLELFDVAHFIRHNCSNRRHWTADFA
jgi:hypothetical protein